MTYILKHENDLYIPVVNLGFFALRGAENFKGRREFQGSAKLTNLVN